MSEVRIEKVSHKDDFIPIFDAYSRAFGNHTPLLNALNPLHDTPKGKEKGIIRMQKDWIKHKDESNHSYIKAIIDDKIAGFAIWIELSIENLTNENANDLFDLDEIYSQFKPEIASTQKEWLIQVWRSYVAPRRKFVKNLSNVNQSVMCLELCFVDPLFQRKGVGKILTQWGINQAKERKNCSFAIVEATLQGTGCYEKAGFKSCQLMDFSNCDRKLIEIRPFPQLNFMTTNESY